jgi:hypothetical protein
MTHNKKENLQQNNSCWCIRESKIKKTELRPELKPKPNRNLKPLPKTSLLDSNLFKFIFSPFIYLSNSAK